MKKLAISIIGFILFVIGLFSALDDLGFVVEVTDEYLANPQNVTAIVDISTSALPHLIHGMVISAVILAIFGAVIGVIKQL